MKSLILVPHQDDEINLVGNILSRLVAYSDVYVVYSSLSIEFSKAAIREKEARQALAVYGVKQDNIYFLGAPDTPNENGDHFFLHIQEREKFVNALCKTIVCIMPDIIFCSDFDFHSDHRMLSLALEEAMSRLLESDSGIRPALLKGFCYETGYYAIPDYTVFNLKFCRITGSELSSNPSYRWEDRISIPRLAEQNSMIWNTKEFQALCCHRSQYAVLEASSIINADNVFWERRVDNLALGATVMVSSGSGIPLNDFKILDTDDLFTINPESIDYSKSLWRPDDSDSTPVVEMQLNKVATIRMLVLHSCVSDLENKEIKFDIFLDGKFYTCVNVNLQAHGRGTEIYLGEVIFRTIRLVFHGYIQLSEIELLENQHSGITEMLNKVFHIEKEKKPVRYCFILELVNSVGWFIIQIYQKILRRLHF